MKRHSEISVPGKLVIVVDDDLAVRNSLKFSLEVEGFAVRVYASGNELLNAQAFSICNCLVVDQRMPDMSGLELIARLRNLNVKAPAILMTTHPSGALSRLADRADIPIVEKPLLGNALVDRIRKACANGNHRQK